MKNIQKTNIFKSTIKETDYGILTSIITDVEITLKQSISFSGKSLLASYVYQEDSTFKLVYIVVKTDGNIESFTEDDGILPTFFLSPNQENYVSIIPYHSEKELEISIPVFNRENIEQPKGNKPFVGNFIGTSNQHSILFDVDIWSNNKPDKLQSIEFKNGIIKKKYNLKIELPRQNKIFISNDEIHLLSNNGSHWLHRQIDELGNEIRRRKIDTKHKYFREIISLSFEKNSYLLAETEDKIIVEKIDQKGKGNTVNLIEIADPLYNTWNPINIADNISVIRFNTEFGNGWFTVKEDQVLDFYYNKEVRGYKNLLTGETLQMEHENLIISDINKTTENSYAVIFYPNTENKLKNKEIIILNVINKFL